MTTNSPAKPAPDAKPSDWRSTLLSYLYIPVLVLVTVLAVLTLSRLVLGVDLIVMVQDYGAVIAKMDQVVTQDLAAGSPDAQGLAAEAAATIARLQAALSAALQRGSAPPQQPPAEPADTSGGHPPKERVDEPKAGKVLPTAIVLEAKPVIAPAEKQPSLGKDTAPAMAPAPAVDKPGKAQAVEPTAEKQPRTGKETGP